MPVGPERDGSPAGTDLRARGRRWAGPPTTRGGGGETPVPRLSFRPSRLVWDVRALGVGPCEQGVYAFAAAFCIVSDSNPRTSV